MLFVLGSGRRIMNTMDEYPMRILQANSVFTNTVKRVFIMSPPGCCDTGQNDTIGKIELNPTFVLSHKSANSRNDIQ